MCEKIDACLALHVTLYLLRAGAGDAAKSGRFIGQFSWVTGDPMGVKGLLSVIDKALYNPLMPVAISQLLELIGRLAYILAGLPEGHASSVSK